MRFNEGIIHEDHGVFPNDSWRAWSSSPRSEATPRLSSIGAGSTPQGDYLRGVGIAAMGMGIYNEKTAIAKSINLDTDDPLE